ncbi:MAG: formylglycine-generating enzyme family protein [Opitutaceae bacterium]|nr:formylglycine-generating enzyme family protein [Opitutaceae bacterium]
MKKKFHEKYTGEFEEKIPLWIKLRPWILSLLGLALLATACLVIYNTGLKDPAKSVIRSSDDAGAIKLSEEITALEKIYTDGVEAELVTPEAVAALRSALEKQRLLLSTFPNQNADQTTRLDRLERSVASENAKTRLFDINRRKTNAEEAAARKNTELAIAEYQAALDLQREVNNSSADSKLKNFGNESAFARAIGTLKAEPLAKERDDAVAAAHAAAQSLRWQDDRTAYTTAARLQTEINRQYPDTRFSDPASASRLNAEILSLNAAPEADAIREMEEAGDRLLAENKYADAAALFADARALQAKLNTEHPGSRFVTSVRVEELEVKQQTALSSPLADKLAPLDASLTAAIAAQKFDDASAAIRDAAALVASIQADFPKSRRLDAVLRHKIAYLNIRAAKLADIHRTVSELLLPLPSSPSLRLLKCETPQPLYDLVMGGNPSRNPGRDLPVDSVTWNEAREFCTRLTWLLGHTVRLPSEKEFFSALSVENPGTIINKTNTQNQRTRAALSGIANAFGFHNLLGNLSEWLNAPDASPNAPHIGGSYLDEDAAVLKIPIVENSKRERLRDVGFRFIVERG